MSGGNFGHAYHYIEELAWDIQYEIDMNHSEEDYRWDYRPETISIIQKAQDSLLIISEMVKEIEWLYSGDTGEDTFNERYNNLDIGSISDGYHTFDELYEFRKMYNAALFNEWAASGKYDVHKSKKHYDGDECFGGSHFIVVAILPSGQISNHYKLEDWDLFKIKSVEKALYPYDGHTGFDVLDRIRQLL